MNSWKKSSAMVEETGKSQYCYYLLFLLVSILFLLLASTTTSPFYNTVGYDSAIFAMMGRLFLEGLTPYTDYFDHKGPTIVFIEAIGLSFSSNEKLSLFILQTINLTIVQVLIFRCARFFLSPLNSIAVVLFTLLMLSITFQGGNSTEEFSLPFLFAGLYTALSYYFSDIQKVKILPMFLTGLFISILFWLRLTNIGILCACVLFIFIMCLQKKDTKEAIKVIVWNIIGFLSYSLLVILYFYTKGALDEMIYSTFTYNIKYSLVKEFDIKHQSEGIFHYVRTYITFSILLFGASYYYRKTKNRSLLILSGLMLFVNLILTILIGPKFYHYMTLNIPCATLGFIFIAVLWKPLQQKIGSIFFVFLAVFLFLGYSVLKLNKEVEDDTKYIEEVHNTISLIPEKELNSIFAYQVDIRFWTYSKLKPYFRYFFTQEQHGAADNQILKDINNKIESDPPIWIVIGIGVDLGINNNTQLLNIIEQDYYLITGNSEFELYRLKSKTE